MDEILQQLSRCISFFRQNDNENLRIATEWLTDFCSQPLSVQYILTFIKTAEDPADRQHAIINLDRSLRAVWDSLDPSVQRDHFEELLHLLLQEPKWINRRNIIDIIEFVDNPSFDLLLLDFIKEATQANQNVYLEMALLLSRFIPANHDEHDINFEVVVPMFQSMLEQGLASEQPEVRLAAFDFFIHSYPFKEYKIIENNPDYWIPIISSLDMFISISSQPTGNYLFSRLIFLFTQSISKHFLSEESALSLNQQILSYFGQALDESTDVSLDITTFLSLHTIIYYICQYYSEYLYQASVESIENSDPCIFDELIEMFLFFSKKLFFSADIYPISNAQFFEPTFKELCINSELVERLWNITYTNLDENEPSTYFAFLRSCAATFEKAPDFYSQRYQTFCTILNTSISSGCQLLMDCAAITAREFVTFFFEDSDDLSMELFASFFESCCQNPSAELIETLTVLLERARKTDNIFEKPYPFLIEELKNGQPDVKCAIIPCITALCKWSTVKVVVYSTELLDLFDSLLKSDDETIDTLKSNAVDAIAVIADSIGSEFVNQGYLTSFFQFFSQIISQAAETLESMIDPNNLSYNDIDVALIVSCLKAIDKFICVFEEKDISSELIEAIVPILLQNASLIFPQLSEEIPSSSISFSGMSSPSKAQKSYKNFENIENSDIISENDAVDNFDTFDNDQCNEAIFQVPAWALRCLADILIQKEAFYEELHEQIMELISIHMISVSEDCRVAAAYSIGACVITVCNLNTKRSNIPTSANYAKPLYKILKENIQSLNSMEVNIEVFRSASLIVAYSGYDQLYGKLDKYLEAVKTFISDPTFHQWRPKNPERDIYDSIADFLDKLCCSANNDAIKLVSQLIPKFSKMDEMGNRFKSFALRFFTSLFSNGISSVDPELKQNVMQSAMKMAAEGKDYTPFSFFTAMAGSKENYSIMEPFLNEIIPMIIEKLNLECFDYPILRDLLIRDNCLIALSSLFNGIPLDTAEKKVPNSTEIMAYLKAFPPAIEISGNRTVAKFFIYLYTEYSKEENKTEKFPENLPTQFLMALVTIFQNPECVIRDMLSGDEILKFEEIFLDLLNEIPNAQQLCRDQLNDEHKIAFLTQSIQRAQEDLQAE